MADKHEREQSNPEATEPKASIFDLFEPPPERGPSSFGKIPIVKEDEIDLTDSSHAEAKAAADAEAAGLQHWTAPPTGQVPKVLATDKDESSLWADVKGPSWHGDDPSWSGPDLADVFADTDSVSFNGGVDYDDEYDDDDDDDDFDSVAVQRPVRAVASNPGLADAGAKARQGDETQFAPPPPTRAVEPPPQARPERGDRVPPPAPVARKPVPEPDTDPAPGVGSRPPAPRPSVVAPAPVRPGRHDVSSPVPAPERLGAAAVEPDLDDLDFGDEFDDFDETDSPRSLSSALDRGRANGRSRLAGPEPSIDDIEFADSDYYDEDELDESIGLSPEGGRDIPKAVGVGLALAAVVLGAMWLGPYATLLVVAVLALLAVLELYNAMRMAGLRPATLLGIVGTVAAPAAAYYRGDAAFPLIVALAVVFGTLWYLVGADTERPVLNLSLTILGIFWVGGLAAFAALMLRLDGGIQLLLATIIITVASDTMAYIGGRAYGSRPFHHASPNKTWEGTITGFLGALFAGFAIGVTDMGTIWDGNLVPALALGAVVGCLAPMGDLAESVVKRDLGVKDMGTLLPGHGGVLDRLDGLLFALPGAYYLALVYGLI